jgi:hypothetical protein
LLNGFFNFFCLLRVLPKFGVFTDAIFFFQFDALAIYVKETPSTPPGVLKSPSNVLL